MMNQKDNIEVIGAKVHNLKNINVNIPRNSLTVITGLSGSGKSSLAFDTIYAEGQRRYIETFSAYVRNFLGGIERPNVDKITGLSPVISIEQKTTNKNPRSTVGTVTEIYDFLRLLYARAGTAYSYETGEMMVKYTEDQIVNLITDKYNGKRIYILAPVVRSRKGHYKELFEQIRKKGYLYARVDGEIIDVTTTEKIDRYKNHNIEIVIDKLIVNQKDTERLQKSIATAMVAGGGMTMILEHESGIVRNYSKRLMCPTTGLSYNDPAPNNFSFNSPQGACPCCKGLGTVCLIDKDKIIPNDNLSIYDGALAPLGKYRNTMIFWQLAALLEKHELDLKTPVNQIPEEVIHEIIHGSEERIKIKASVIKTENDFFTQYEGLAKYIRQLTEADSSSSSLKWAESFDTEVVCPECQGKRLNREALSFKIADMNIHDLSVMDLNDLHTWINGVNDKLNSKQQKIAAEIIKEISNRLQFLLNVGLEYLSLNRTSMSLSGGESQRIRLATQIGSKLVNVLYILDEPSI